MKLCVEDLLISLKLPIALFLFLLSSNLSNPLSSIAAANNNETDYEALVCLRHQLLKHQSSYSSPATLILNSWMNDTNKHVCSWEGITCGRKHPDRVIALNLSSIGLMGPLPTCISNLTFLTSLDLANNSLYGEVPPSLSRLKRLQFLILSINSLQGPFPTNLSSKLIVLGLFKNNFSGKIPFAFFFLSKLKYLSISYNNNSGNIPTSVGNLSSIEYLYMVGNNLEGIIPAQIGSLTNLTFLNLSLNNLSGIIPSSIYNLSYLSVLYLTENYLSGSLSSNIASSLPQLERLYLGGNMLSGSLIQALFNCTNLAKLELAENKLTGRIPPDLGNLRNLNFLNLQSNKFESDDVESWKFIDSLANCTNLQLLDLGINELGGFLPKSIGNLSIQLQYLGIFNNHVFGRIPTEIEKLINLNTLSMGLNNLTGDIPHSIGKLKKLQEFFIGLNGLTGIIPWSLANLTDLSEMDLGSNQLTGIIPSNIGNLSSLYILILDHNKLVGTIPKELFGISALSRYLGLADNHFSGELPPEVGKLVSLNFLDLSRNKFTGMIPQSLGSCQMLTKLYLDMNLFYGPIPTTLGRLQSLEILDLSQNNLSGTIPISLQNLNLLRLLNLSNNKFEGEVPNVGVFQNATAIHLHGNTELCGGIRELHLPACVEDSANNNKHKRMPHRVLKILIQLLGVGAFLIFVSIAAFFYYYRYKIQHQRRINASPRLIVEEPFPMISYAQLVKATDEFSSINLIGRGRYGSVYKGTLDQSQTTVAIKVFDLSIHGGFRSFEVECDALRNIRHRNIVKVLTSCTTTDFNGKYFMALVFEFMPKGSLDTWLHQEDGTHLQLEQILNIAINVADALEYLHHSCKPPIIHCDIKPSNILLDDNIVAHVGDFGLARILSESTSMLLQNSDSKSLIKGTIGYVPPEYGSGAHPSSSGDAYSFGIILLEMLTGRKPTDDIFKDELNLHNLVASAYPHLLTNIVDPKLLVEEQNEGNPSNAKGARRDNRKSIIQCLGFVAEVGLSCSAISPAQRLSMRDFAAKLHAIRATYLQSKQLEEKAQLNYFLS